jgi:N-methylhydantoinase A
LLLGVDIGGTFTDFVYQSDNGSPLSFKIPSTPSNPAAAIDNGLKLVPEQPEAFLHGTTVATNTVLQRKGSRTALITTRGFRDLLQIGRQVRAHLYDFKVTRPSPIINRKHCYELTERVDASGKILIPINEDELEAITEKLERARVKAIAVCFLFSYTNPGHERKVGGYLKKKLGLPITLSSEILPEFREFERFSTAAMNAYLLSPVGKYLKELTGTMKKTGLKDYFVMQSSGGVALSSYIRNMPVRTLMSGPAAGVAAAAELGKLTGESNLITFDMGGTSADVAAVIDNNIVWSSEGSIDSLPIKVPMVSIETIGAGGGSIAWQDSGGALQVGPQSAGADPGPVCYDKGGKNITVTDANLLLGIINPEFFLGGKFNLNPSKSIKAADVFAKKLGLTTGKMAEGVQRVVEANMLRAVKKVSVEKGFDPEKFALVAFGGAGPIHAAAIAKELKIPRIIVPYQPGTFSAFGLLVSDIKFDYSQTFLADLSKPGTEVNIKSIIDKHQKTALRTIKAQRLELNRAEFYPSVDLRYKGQSFEVNVPLESTFKGTADKFHSVHEKRFGYSVPDAPVELVNIRLGVTVLNKNQRTENKSKHKNHPAFQKKKKRTKSIGSIQPEKKLKTIIEGTRYNTPLYDRALLVPGLEFSGPAVVSDSGSTTLIRPGMTARIDSYGNLIIITNTGG